MPDHPILFSAPMVRALLDGRKTQTRRIIRLTRDMVLGGITHDDLSASGFWNCWQAHDDNPKCQFHHWQYGDEWIGPNYQPGDRLWVKETFAVYVPPHLKHKELIFAADPLPHPALLPPDGKFHWHPSIYMPRWASRLTLEITDVRVQRVQEISEADAKAEGATARLGPPQWGDGLSYRYGFSILWDSINAKRGYGWEKNPWVWALTFKRVSYA